MASCSAAKISNLSASSVLGTWNCNAAVSKIDRFEVQFEKHNGSRWVTEAVQSVPTTSKPGGGKKGYQATYPAPDAAFSTLRFRVRAVSKTYKDKKTKKDKKYFSTTAWATSNAIANPNATAASKAAAEAPPAPSAPSASLDPADKGRAVVTGFGVSTDLAAKVRLYKRVNGGGDQLVGEYAKSTASVAVALAAGTWAQFRAVSYNTSSGAASASSAWSGAVYGVPKVPASLAARSERAAVALVEWGNGGDASGEATEVAWSPRRDFADGSAGSGSASTDGAGDERMLVEVDASASGSWYFRARRVRGELKSAWTATVGPVLLGSDPEAPTTYATLGSYAAGEAVRLRWAHNCEDRCDQRAAQVQWRSGGGGWQTVGVEGPASEAMLPTDGLADGSEVSWRVRTQAVTGAWSDWSGERAFSVYSPPVLEVTLADGAGSAVSGGAPLESLPLVARLELSGTSSAAVAFSAWVTCEDAVEYADAAGDARTAPPGSTMWRGYVDSSGGEWGGGGSAEFRVGPGNGIVSGAGYVFHAVVAVANGLRADAEVPFSAGLGGTLPAPSARVEVVGGWAAVIYPACEVIDDGTGDTVPVLDDGGNPRYYDDGGAWPVVELVPDVELAVWREDAWGNARLVASGIPNDGASAVLDPHPNFGECAYRIVATSTVTGAVEHELETVDVECDSVVVQWDEDWSSVDGDGDPAYGGMLLELPYNIKQVNEADWDCALPEYFGDDAPTLRSGTQRGVSGRWSADLEYAVGSDGLRAARRLQGHMGQVYVREPSGIGYDAVVKVTETLEGGGLVGLSLDVTRVMPAPGADAVEVPASLGGGGSL